MIEDISPPPIEPVSLAEAKLFLRVDHDADNDLIALLIRSARERLEAYLGLAMIARPMAFTSKAKRLLRISRYPVISVDHVEADGAPAGDYHANLKARPSLLCVDARDEVRVEFTAGYGTDPDDVPAPLRQAMLLLVARGYEMRGEAVDGAIPLMVDALTLPYKAVGL